MPETSDVEAALRSLLVAAEARYEEFGDEEEYLAHRSIIERHIEEQAREIERLNRVLAAVSASEQDVMATGYKLQAEVERLRGLLRDAKPFVKASASFNREEQIAPWLESSDILTRIEAALTQEGHA